MTSLAVALPSSPDARRYDGPFDVLISLIRRNDYPIDALPVAQITGQFLDYIKTHEIDQDLAGDFMDTSSWLVLLKSRSLLPKNEDDSGPSPQEELRRILLEYGSVKSVAAILAERHPRSVAPKVPDAVERNLISPSPPTLGDLLETARLAVETAHAVKSLSQAVVETVTLEDQLRWISEKLLDCPRQEAVSTEQWFKEQSTPTGQALLFLALLESARTGALLIHQRKDFSDILVKAL